MSQQSAPEASTSNAVPTFGTFSAEVTRTDTVVIPDDVRKDFANAVTYFSANSNRTRLTVGFPTEDDAKLFIRRAVAYGQETGHRALTTRDGKVVTFRFSKPRTASHTSPVTVTNVSDSANS